MKGVIRRLVRESITFRGNAGGNQSFLLACMPKSGSTWITQTFNRMPCCKRENFVPTGGAREQEIDTWTINYALFRSRNLNTMAQQHVKYNVNTRKCLIRHGIRPIVLTRSIKDNLVSLVDHWRREDSNPGFSAYIERNYFNEDFTLSVKSSSTPLEYATILHAPWVLNFYLSWKKYNSNPAGGLPVELSPIFISYEEFVDSPYEAFSSLFQEMGLEFTDQELWNAINDPSKKTRMNVGISGRGEEAFSKDEQAMTYLNRVLDLYRHEDLSGIGVR